MDAGLRRVSGQAVALRSLTEGRNHTAEGHGDEQTYCGNQKAIGGATQALAPQPHAASVAQRKNDDPNSSRSGR